MVAVAAPRLNWRIGYYWDKPGFNQTDKHPVVCVSRSDAIAYVKWLVQKTGKKYRLPSEAEWEYAARGNTDTARYWGEDTKVACRYANVADMTSGHQGIGRIVKHECSDNYFFTAPVGSFLPNAFGLYDMLGNAAEWVADNYHNSYRFAPTDGSVWQGSDAWGGILRGGSWNDIPQDVRSSTRIRNDSTLRYSGGGFRISKTLP